MPIPRFSCKCLKYSDQLLVRSISSQAGSTVFMSGVSMIITYTLHRGPPSCPASNLIIVSLPAVLLVESLSSTIS
jgi:hypothetical protein